MKKAVTFGEIMLRLQPPSYERFLQAGSFDAVYGGGKANVAVSLSRPRRRGQIRHPPARQSARLRLPQPAARLGRRHVGHRVRRRPYRHLFLRKGRVAAAFQCHL